MIIEIVLLIPSPNSIMDSNSTYSTTDISGNAISFRVEELLAAYVTVRSAYFLRFIIHF